MRRLEIRSVGGVKIPQQPVRGGFSQILHCLLIKRIGGCHQNGFAHPVECSTHQRRQTSAGKPRVKSMSTSYFSSGQKRRARPVGQQLEGFFPRQNLFLREGLDERFDHIRAAAVKSTVRQHKSKITPGDDFCSRRKFAHRLAAIVNFRCRRVRLFAKSRRVGLRHRRRRFHACGCTATLFALSFNLLERRLHVSIVRTPL